VLALGNLTIKAQPVPLTLTLSQRERGPCGPNLQKSS